MPEDNFLVIKYKFGHFFFATYTIEMQKNYYRSRI